MFERRLKILLGILIALTLVVLLRAAQVQILQGDDWRKKAEQSMERSQPVETVRGRILDCKGRVLASDEPCIDAAVEYPAIVREEEWMKAKAAARLTERLGDAFTKARKSDREKMVKDELISLNDDLTKMWATLAKLSGKAPDEIEEIKAGIRACIGMRWRMQIYKMAEDARGKYRKDKSSGYAQWLLGGSDAPDEDKFSFIRIPEQKEAHVVVPGVPVEVANYIRKHESELPGLIARPSKHRAYPYGSAACHVIGHMGVASREEIKASLKEDKLRQLVFNDQVGKGGIEALCEDALRGTRGQIKTIIGRPGIIGSVEPQNGRDVKITIDIELERRIENAFQHAQFWDEHGQAFDEKEQAHELHGAAVVIDVATGEVRAMVSYPTFDLNEFDHQYHQLLLDNINLPLLNRATQMALPPGSTAKPMVGLGAVTSGAWPLDKPVECTGYLVIDGVRETRHACWVVTNLLIRLGKEKMPHHQIPPDDPHPTGYLLLADAIQRSCNVFFETVGDKLGLEGLSVWYEKFGLGNHTGIGLAEISGQLPRRFLQRHPQAAPKTQRIETWNCSIGQSQVLATPIQMANVAATIARGGIWKRPRLVLDESELPDRLTKKFRPDEDLNLSPGALSAVRDGMTKVVNTRAGSANQYIGRKIKGVLLAGKTGTAQATPFQPPILDEKGVQMRKANGDLAYEPPLMANAPSVPDHSNPEAPWYRGHGITGNDVSHAWFIGFAPADNPKFAFAVCVEYGGGGGHATYSMVKAIVDGLIDLGYLPRE